MSSALEGAGTSGSSQRQAGGQSANRGNFLSRGGFGGRGGRDQQRSWRNPEPGRGGDGGGGLSNKDGSDEGLLGRQQQHFVHGRGQGQRAGPGFRAPGDDRGANAAASDAPSPRQPNCPRNSPRNAPRTDTGRETEGGSAILKTSNPPLNPSPNHAPSHQGFNRGGRNPQFSGRGHTRGGGRGAHEAASWRPQVSPAGSQVGKTEKWKNVPQLVQELEEKLARGEVECMICYEQVGRSKPVWSCGSCFAIFHLPCIKQWARAPSSSAGPELASANQSQSASWRCPGCQSQQSTTVNNMRYRCFCGGRSNPPDDPYLTPHSCGEPCGTPLDPKGGAEARCPHRCTMQCHPGPHPPCTAMAPPQKCYCGNTSQTMRCGDPERLNGRSCGGMCEKRLACGRHACEKKCHPGACEPCSEVVVGRCFCGAKEEALACGELGPGRELSAGLFSCQGRCGKQLDCGKHSCSRACHEGPCGGCERVPERVLSCPCGKKSLQQLGGERRTECTDPIATCGQICGRPLRCGHTCQKKCHEGECAQNCAAQVRDSCRCGGETRTVPCHVANADGAPFLCARACGRKKSCGRHRCSEVCCPAGAGHVEAHQCTLTCGKKLQCGHHTCPELCHAGYCPPCVNSGWEELRCACGKTSIPPPVPCGTLPPACPFPCSFEQACGHEATHLCHSNPPCPPCQVLVTRPCAGGHVTLRNVPCGSKDLKCTQPCGRPRECGVHQCARMCHVPPCSEAESLEAGEKPVGGPGVWKREAKHSCGQSCGAPRKDCNHRCQSVCHPGEACPEVACKEPVTISCSCGRLTAQVPCCAGAPGGSSPVEKAAIVKLAKPLQPLPGGVAVPLGKRQLACDDECQKLEKRRLLASAFGATPPGEGDAAASAEALLEVLRREPGWIAAVESRLQALAQGLKTGGGSARAHVFRNLPSDRREMIHHLAERWGLASKSVGREPRRVLVVYGLGKGKPQPTRPLSRQPLQESGLVFNPELDLDYASVLEFRDLARETNLASALLRFAGECELLWLNDRNALVIFGDAARAATALRYLDHATAYRGVVTPPAVTRPPGGLKPARRRGQAENWQEDAWGEEDGAGHVGKAKPAPGGWKARGEGFTLKQENVWTALGEEDTGGPVGARSAKADDGWTQVPTKAKKGGVRGEPVAEKRPEEKPRADAWGESNRRSAPVVREPVKSVSPSKPVDKGQDIDDWEQMLD